MKGPYTEVVADSKEHAERDARHFYKQTNPQAELVGGSRDERKTFHVYDLDDERVQA